MNRFMMMAVAVMLLAACGMARADDDFRKREEDDIREAVFRYQFERLVFAEMRSVQNYYLSFGENDQDPPNDFMKRFSACKPPVKKVSSCSGSKSGHPVKDKKTGESGLIFRVTRALHKNL